MFTEANAVENLVRDLLAGPRPSRPAGVAQAPAYAAAGLSKAGSGWHRYIPSLELPRRPIAISGSFRW